MVPFCIDTMRYWLKVGTFLYLVWNSCHVNGDSLKFRQTRVIDVENCSDMFSSFDTTPRCDGYIDGRTDLSQHSPRYSYAYRVVR